MKKEQVRNWTSTPNYETKTLSILLNGIKFIEITDIELETQYSKAFNLVDRFYMLRDINKIEIKYAEYIKIVG